MSFAVDDVDDVDIRNSTQQRESELVVSNPPSIQRDDDEVHIEEEEVKTPSRTIFPELSQFRFTVRLVAVINFHFLTVVMD